MTWSTLVSMFFFFNDTATTEIYTLSLHDALPILVPARDRGVINNPRTRARQHFGELWGRPCIPRSEEHTSELQSQSNLVCRLLLEKKKKTAALAHHTYISSLRRTYLSLTRMYILH